ncbi:MAG: FecR family protein [Chitinophagaceae bacterium]
MPNNKIWELIAKKLSGEASVEELGELEQLLKANPDMHYPMQTVADLWHHATPDTEDAHLAFTKHADRMKELGISPESEQEPGFTTPHTSRRKKQLYLALTFLLLVTAGYFSRSLFFGDAVKPRSIAHADKSEVSTKYGSRTKLLLPDSTQVWLNSGSKLSYDKSYGNGIREVSLQGEAFFDVVKNPAHPFVIHTSSIDIKVLGTAFNVKSFPGEKNTETSLIRGSIEVTIHNRPDQKIILSPNEKLITANEQPLTTTARLEKNPMAAKLAAENQANMREEPIAQVSHLTYEPRDSTVIETSWMENKLIFRSETFEDLSVKMERWYGVNIRFADEAIKPKRLNGIFENETIQQALKALQLITPFAYKMNKTEIIISSK